MLTSIGAGGGEHDDGGAEQSNVPVTPVQLHATTGTPPVLVNVHPAGTWQECVAIT